MPWHAIARGVLVAVCHIMYYNVRTRSRDALAAGEVDEAELGGARCTVARILSLDIDLVWCVTARKQASKAHGSKDRSKWEQMSVSDPAHG
jgi:hypothetical protein